jgi:hypothetical protein
MKGNHIKIITFSLFEETMKNNNGQHEHDSSILEYSKSCSLSKSFIKAPFYFVKIKMQQPGNCLQDNKEI